MKLLNKVQLYKQANLGEIALDGAESMILSGPGWLKSRDGLLTAGMLAGGLGYGAYKIMKNRKKTEAATKKVNLR